MRTGHAQVDSLIMRKTDTEALRDLRKAAREYLRETACAVDCDQDAVDRAFKKLARLAGYKR